MTNAKKCDRCGKLYEFYNGFSVEEGGNRYNKFSLYDHWNTVKHEYDLCPDCMLSLVEWIKNYENSYPIPKFVEDKTYKEADNEN